MMMLRVSLFWTLLLVVVSVHCFQRLQQQQQNKGSSASVSQHDGSRHGLFPPKIQDQSILQDRQILQWDSSSILRTKQCSCPPDGIQSDDDNDKEEEDVISNVGEAAFAMLGSLWAEEGSNIIPTSLLFPNAAVNDNNKDVLWRIGEQQQQEQHDDKDLVARTRIRAVLQELMTNNPYYAKDANLDSISAHVLQ
mmetsp:Transcript_26729/g.64998  ORF Transcript_26729/g.64998 Transcript_26729/m.64998 type:complete len:194 (+) Transcript_26729:32-613(+)